MALADTARLIASLELQDKFSATAAKYEKALGSMERKTNTLDKVGFQIGRGARNAIDNVGKIAVVGAGLIASQVAIGVKSLAQLETITNQTNAAIESTGSAANVSADHVRELAESLEDLSTVDDKTIQAGANLLLTFTKIRNEIGAGNDVFDRATDAALNLSIAGFGSMESTAKQVGKALNDPIKGVTALRKAGVQLTEQQTAQIKKFVESGQILEAQKVILAELETQVGKSAEAFGKGPAADMRRFGDAVEGAQQALATGFLPLIQKVSKRVQEALGDPKVLANIKSFGESAAKGIDQLIDIGTKLPWDAIGQSAKLMGQGAKALLDAFTAMPPWVQTAVLTSWGLNKLTGGALGNIAGTLAKSAFGQIRGATAATPVFTKEVGVPGGGGGTGPLAGGGKLAGILKILGVASLAAFAVELGIQQGEETGQAKSDFERSGEKFFGLFGSGKALPVEVKNLPATPIGQFTPANQGGTPAPFSLGKGVLKTVDAQIARVQTQQTRFIRGGTDKQARLLQSTIDALHVLHGDSRSSTDRFIAGLGKVHSGLSAANRNLDEGTQQQRQIARGVDRARERIGTGFQRQNDLAGAANSKLDVIKSKDFSPRVSVSVTSNVTISEIQRRITSAQIAIGRGPQEFFNGGF